MEVVNIVSGIILTIASILIIFVVLTTNTDNTGLNSAIGGGSNSFYGKNGGDRSEAKRELAVKIIVAVFFVVAIVATILAKFFGKTA